MGAKSEHGTSDQVRHGLPVCDWSLHGLDSERALHPKTTQELQTELMALFEDALRHGTVTLTDDKCDLAHLHSHQSAAPGDARKRKLRERILQTFTFGRKSTGT